MFVIRHFEENLVGLHDKGVFGGHYHLYVGQEATGVPALACLDADDYLFTTHRNHGHLLARGAEPKKLFAEILGRVDGLNKGKGGSFHSVAPALGFLHSSGVVAGIIPLSTGTAYAGASNGKTLNPQAITPVGGDQPHENRPPHLTLNYCIALQGIFPARD